MREVEKYGGKLNSNFGQATATYPEARAAKSFIYTSYLDKADAIINFCKLKTHGMMGMSAAVKNMFGVVPGTLKPEYHYLFPSHAAFADMLVDLNEYFAPKTQLCICDAVVGMEGNGPTAGSPRKVGAILASPSPYLLDLGRRADRVDIREVPTLEAAYRRGLAPASAVKFWCRATLRGFGCPILSRSSRRSIREVRRAGGRLFSRQAISLAPGPG